MWYFDFDGDGFGDDNDTVYDCSAPQYYVSVGGDCDDNNININPDEQDNTSNGVDNNCDGQIDEGVGQSVDVDGDGFSSAQGDCDDTDNTVYPEH